MRRASLLLVAPLLLACSRKSEEVSKPADPPAPKPSVSASAALPPLVVAVTDERCDDGFLSAPKTPSDAGVDSSLIGPGDSFGYGGLGLSGTGTGGDGWGEGIGLGTIGGFGHGTEDAGPPVPVAHLKGQTLRVEGLPIESAEQTICAGYAAFHKCYDGDAGVMEGTLGFTLSIGSGGAVEGATAIGEPPSGSESVASCVLMTTRGLTFAAPASKTASVSYALLSTKELKIKHHPSTVKMIEKGATIDGRLPPDVVKRIVRANFPRFRACYEAGLKRDPLTKGTVSVEFVIDTTGAVESASLGSGSLGEGGVKSCVLGVFRTLSFPEPEGGKVKVTYPIDFQKDE
jgi:hypothetical protein